MALSNSGRWFQQKTTLSPQLLSSAIRGENTALQSMLGSSVQGLNDIAQYKDQQEQEAYKQYLQSKLLNNYQHTGSGINERVNPMFLNDGSNAMQAGSGFSGYIDPNKRTNIDHKQFNQRLLNSQYQNQALKAQNGAILNDQTNTIQSYLNSVGDANNDGYVDINDLNQTEKQGLLQRGSIDPTLQSSLLGSANKNQQSGLLKAFNRKQQLIQNAEDEAIRRKRVLSYRPTDDAHSLDVRENQYNQQIKLQQPIEKSKTLMEVAKNQAIIDAYGNNPAYANQVLTAKNAIRNAQIRYNTIYPDDKILDKSTTTTPTPPTGSQQNSSLLMKEPNQVKNKYSTFNNKNYWNLLSQGKTIEYANKNINSKDDAIAFIKTVPNMSNSALLKLANKNKYIGNVITQRMESSALKNSYNKDGSFDYVKYRKLTDKIPYGKNKNPTTAFADKYNFKKALSEKYGKEKTDAILDKIEYVMRPLTEVTEFTRKDKGGKMKMYQNKLHTYHFANFDNFFDKSIYDDGQSLMDDLVGSFVKENNRMPTIDDFQDLLQFQDKGTLFGTFDAVRLNNPILKQYPIGRAILGLRAKNIVEGMNNDK